MNSKRGGVTLKTDDGEYVLRITTNAMVAYQDAMGTNFIDDIGTLQNDQGDVKKMRNLFWVGLNHGDGISADLAGDIMDDAGIAAALEKLMEAAVLAFPQAEEGTGGNGKAGKPAKKATS